MATHHAGETSWNNESFANRHIGPRDEQISTMLKALDLGSLEALIEKTIPADIRIGKTLELPRAMSEATALQTIKGLAQKNQVKKSFLGMGFYPNITPSVIKRNILENPGWYTQYTPYQAEISQGRLEALLNFQTMIMELTSMEVANASLLDEATAVAEGVQLAFAARKRDGANQVLVSHACHPYVLEVLHTRAKPLGIKVKLTQKEDAGELDQNFFALVFPQITTDGKILDLKAILQKAKDADCMSIISADLMSLVLLTPPGELGADIVVGNTQRFGVPMGFGGPHAAFFATRDEHKRRIPGRIIGVSVDKEGNPGFRLTLQTREQHIRREKATSNICTSQVLLAIMASMYAVYHGPEGLTQIAHKIADLTQSLARGLKALGTQIRFESFFDTIRTKTLPAARLEGILLRARKKNFEFRIYEDDSIGISLDETTTMQTVKEILECFSDGTPIGSELEQLLWERSTHGILESQVRKTPILKHPVFRAYRSETEMMRYLKKLEHKDLSLTTSMIPLGSCTMKLNAASEMFPITWEEFSNVHPYTALDHVKGYLELVRDLEKYLAEITGFHGVSLQPNSGAQGEYAGLLVVNAYLAAKGQTQRNVCLIPESAHGTNPASAAMAGLEVFPVKCDELGNIDLEHLRSQCSKHHSDLAVVMLTYPSTHGVFEDHIREVCSIVHESGGQVYMDGANLNAQVGLCRPGDYGPDLCHINLHKTFCIPHGGGGPGMGPIAVKSHLTPFLPKHRFVKLETSTQAIGPVSASPWGSASILPISWMYIRMMGADGLKRASQVAILNANYLAHRLTPHYPILYRGAAGFVAHECIIDLRPIKAKTGVEVEDVAKRLMDFGFHAPTVSFPVPGTLMIEPTESESQEEIDLFCGALIKIREEITDIESGKVTLAQSPLRNAPHTQDLLAKEEWPFSYSREQAIFPLPWVRKKKFWVPVSRIDNAYGDRNFFCSCPEWKG